MSEQGGLPEPAEGWRAVSPELSAGSNTPMPRWVKPVLATGVVVLLGTGGLVGGMLGSSGESAPSPEPSPAFELQPPLVIDELVRGQVGERTGPAPGHQRIVQSDYTDGDNTVVFILTWPEPDVATFVLNAGIEAAEESPQMPNRYCGLSEDTGHAACGEVVDDIGMLLVSVTEQDEAEVSRTLDLFKEAISQ